MPTGIGGELLWLCPTLGGDAVDLTGLNTPFLQGGIASIAHTDHGGTRAYSLDGTNDGIIIPHHTRFDFGTGDFTVSLHCKPATSGNVDLVHKILSSGTFAGFTCQRISGSSRMWTYNGGSTSPHTSRAITIDVWSHVIFMRVSGQLNVFVNGFCIAALAGAQNVTNTVDLCVGLLAAGGWGGGKFAGLLDDIRIFASAISALNRGLLSLPGYQPSGGGTAGFTGIRGLSRRLGT